MPKFKALSKLMNKSSNKIVANPKTVSALVAAGLMLPEDAEAGYIDRRMLDAIVKKLNKLGKEVTRQDLARELELGADPKLTQLNLGKTRELLGHLNLEKQGISEDSFRPVDYLMADYPEASKLEKVTIDKNLTSKDINPNVIGEFVSQGYGSKLNPRMYIKPESIAVNIDKTKSIPDLAAIISHEGQHLRDTLLFPKQQSLQYSVKGMLDGNVIGSQDYPRRVSEILNENPEFRKYILESMSKLNPKLKAIAEKNPEISAPDASALINSQDFAKFYFNPENLSQDKIIDLSTKGHHLQYPNNYELDRSLNIINKKEPIVDVDKLKSNFDELKNEYDMSVPKKASAVAAMPVMMNPEQSIDPLAALKDFKQNIATPVVDNYKKIKNLLTGPLADQMDLTKDKSAKKDLKDALDLGLDPVNLVPGGAGLGLGALQLLGEEEE